MASAAQGNIPDYLNQDLLTRSLANGFHNEGIIVDKFEIAPATAAGDNYMSDVFRINVKYR